VSNIAAQGIVTVGVNRPDHTFALGTTRTVPVYRPERRIISMSYNQSTKYAERRLSFVFNKTIWYFTLRDTLHNTGGWKMDEACGTNDGLNYSGHIDFYSSSEKKFVLPNFNELRFSPWQGYNIVNACK
jgi:hypothetical protein